MPSHCCDYWPERCYCSGPSDWRSCAEREAVEHDYYSHCCWCGCRSVHFAQESPIAAAAAGARSSFSATAVSVTVARLRTLLLRLLQPSLEAPARRSRRSHFGRASDAVRCVGSGTAECLLAVASISPQLAHWTTTESSPCDTQSTTMLL